jgi:hypothetical protein
VKRAVLLVMALTGCAARAPPDEVSTEACSIRPVTVTNRDFFSPPTLAEIRRVNRELRRHCVGD